MTLGVALLLFEFGVLGSHVSDEHRHEGVLLTPGEHVEYRGVGIVKRNLDGVIRIAVVKHIFLKLRRPSNSTNLPYSQVMPSEAYARNSPLFLGWHLSPHHQALLCTLWPIY